MDRLTAKVAIKSHSRNGSLAREIKSRKFYADGAVLVPKLFRYDTSRLIWLEEELIEGDKAVSPDQKKELFLVEHAKQMYAPWARSRSVSNSLTRLGVSWADIQSVFSEAAIVMPAAVKDATWPISLVHGDLSADNMIVGQTGDFYPRLGAVRSRTSSLGFEEDIPS